MADSPYPVRTAPLPPPNGRCVRMWSMYADGSNRNSPSGLSVIPGWAQPRCCCLATVDYRDYSVVKHVCGRNCFPDCRRPGSETRGLPPATRSPGTSNTTTLTRGQRGPGLPEKTAGQAHFCDQTGPFPFDRKNDEFGTVSVPQTLPRQWVSSYNTCGRKPLMGEEWAVGRSGRGSGWRG